MVTAGLWEDVESQKITGIWFDDEKRKDNVLFSLGGYLVP
jgi:hypothetical protein